MWTCSDWAGSYSSSGSWSTGRAGPAADVTFIAVRASACSAVDSGIVSKAMFLDPAAFLTRLKARVDASTAGGLRPKFLPPELQARVYKERVSLYDDIRRKTPRREKVNIGASIVLISACQDNQVAMDGTKNGLFTETLLKIWANGNFAGGYHHFRNAIAALMPPTQSPKYTIVGHRERGFERQKPFTIAVSSAAQAA